VGAIVASNSKNKNSVCMIIQNIKNWLYSFMRDIDSEREYIVSKLLLLSYVSSTEVGAII
jgi:hypothetical protein